MNRFEEMFWATEPALKIIEALHEASLQSSRKWYESYQKWHNRRKNMTVNQKVATAHMVQAMISSYYHQDGTGGNLFGVLFNNEYDSDSLSELINSIDNTVGTEYDIVAREIACWLFEFTEDEREMIIKESLGVVENILGEYIRYKTINGN